ncbi:MAG: DUF3718 domain-containing protein [bacterium]
MSLKFGIILGVLLVGSAFDMTKNARAVDQSLKRLAVTLCDYAKADNRSGIRKKLRDAHYRMKDIYPGLICGSGGSLLRVATTNGAMETAQYIAKKIGKKLINVPEKDGLNIVQWTQSLVDAGDAEKQPYLDVFIAAGGKSS